MAFEALCCYMVCKKRACQKRKNVHAKISYRKKRACQKGSSVFCCMHTSKRALIGRESDAGGLDFRDMQPCTFNMSFQIENSHMYCRVQFATRCYDSQKLSQSTSRESCNNSKETHICKSDQGRCYHPKSEYPSYSNKL